METQESKYNNLNLNREKLDSYVTTFFEQNRFASYEDKEEGDRRILRFGAMGTSPATVILYFKSVGTTTIQYKTGRNHELGKQLADFLLQTIDPMEFESVHMVIDGASSSDVNVVMDDIKTEGISVRKESTSKNESRWKLVSEKYKDNLTVTLYSTNKLNIQGRPLFCYRTLIFYLSEYLNMKGLERVLIRSQNGFSGNVQQYAAENCLKTSLGSVAYSKIDTAIQKLLLSSFCIKLVAPDLPDYSLLLFPELRALEGSAKKALARYGMIVGRTDTFGDVFQRKSSSQTQFELKENARSKILNKALIPVLEETYNFYYKERHGLFHMECLVNTSRMISTYKVLCEKSDECIRHIKEIYELI